MKVQEFNRRLDENGVISVNPMPTQDELAAFYADIYYQEAPSATFSDHYSKEEMEQRCIRAELVLYSLAEAGSKGGGRTFLEVGCGEGFLLHAAKEQGYAVQGVDFSDVGLRNFNPHLLENVDVGDAYHILDNLLSDGEFFDVCAIQNVLEHVIDPKTMLSRIRRILSPDGVAVVTVPNDFSLVQAKLMEKGLIDREFWFQPPQHLHYFNVDSVRKFASHCGFTVVDIFADFPIDFFLFHPGSNYVLKPECGKGAHKARIMLDLLLAERGMPAYHRFCQALSGCGVGRNVTVLLRPHEEGVDRN